jgi:RNA polymerase sigma-70 factor, ECF subfamily
MPEENAVISFDYSAPIGSTAASSRTILPVPTGVRDVEVQVTGAERGRSGWEMLWQRPEPPVLRGATSATLTVGPAAPAAPPAGGSGEPSDEEVLRAIQAGDHAALATLYDRHGRSCFAVAYRVLEDGAAAEDAVQEAFLAVWRQAGSFRPERGAVRTWLLAITRNAAVDRRRGRHARPLGDVPLADVEGRLATDENEVFEVVDASLLQERIRAALVALPIEQRQAIELGFFHGLTHQEIAARTGLPLGTVKGRMRLGLNKLRSLLADVAPAAFASTEG